MCRMIGVSLYNNCSHKHLSGTPHPKTMLCSRYKKFLDSLVSSSKMEVALLANMAMEDNRTVVGKTMSRMKRELECEDLTSTQISKSLKYFPVPPNEEWRLPFIDELLSVDENEYTLDDCFSSADVTAMISALCTS